mmetsp:Transcript_34971/g.91548  ORF Transcript_34971/g.91548 Transcript_34971/m.91548 type:complete len:1076 (+) Transcript_34971:361-3588(+)
MDTRNVSIIAHVDHGKTTLADALLHRAGKLAGAKAGDQNTGRALDGLKAERERGITIKSTGISLVYDVGPEFFERVDAETAEIRTELLVDDASTVSTESSDSDVSIEFGEPVALYVGGLPRHATKETAEALAEALAATAGCPTDELTDVAVNGKRHFAFVTAPAKAASRLLSTTVTFGDRTLTVTRRGDSAIKQLAEVLRSKRFPPCKYDVSPTGDAFSGTATVDGLGLVALPKPVATQKAARESLASMLLALESPAVTPKSVGETEAEAEAEAEAAPAAAPAEAAAAAAAAAAPAPTRTVLDPSSRALTVNLIDSPGHVDFNPEVTSALRMTDGALVVVDVIDGASAQTETVLRQALYEGVRPVLMLNKVDRLFLNKQFKPEAVYDRFVEVVDQINSLIAETKGDDAPFVSLEDGTVAFGSGYFQWAATLDSFVTMADPTLRDPAKRARLRKKLATRKNFCKNVLSGIYKIHSELGLLNTDDVEAPADIAGWLKEHNRVVVKRGGRPAPIPTKEAELAPRKVLKLAMAALLPAADALVEMIALRLPSPLEAQRSRVDVLTAALPDEDDADDEADEEALKSALLTRELVARCDPAAPLLIYVSKICQPSEVGSGHGAGLAVCRCFSGTIKVGQTVMVAGSTRSAKVTAVSMCVGSKMESVGHGSAGQVFALSGVSGLLRKNGTLTNDRTAAPLKGMSFSVSPVVQKSVRPAEPRQLQKMVDALRKAAAADQIAQFYKDRQTGQYVLAGAGELHLEVILNALEEDAKIKVVASEPMVSFRESVTMPSTQKALKKTANKLNRVWFTAEPLAADLVQEMDSGRLDCTDLKAFARELVERHGWDKNVARRVWAVGPEQQAAAKKGAEAELGDAAGMPTCVLVNSTAGLQIPGDVRDTIISSFKRVCEEGVLAGEQLHGVRFDLVDGMFHADSNHRSGAQLDPAVRSALRGAAAYAGPSIFEPLYRLDVSGPPVAINSAYGELTGKRRGEIVESTANENGTQATVVAEMPIRLAFGLTEDIRQATSGKAFLMTSFSRWATVPGDVMDEAGGDARDVICAIRKAKKLSPEPPVAKDFVDRL